MAQEKQHKLGYQKCKAQTRLGRYRTAIGRVGSTEGALTSKQLGDLTRRKPEKLTGMQSKDVAHRARGKERRKHTPGITQFLTSIIAKEKRNESK